MSQEQLSFAEVLTQYEETHRAPSGARQGTVVAITDDDVVIDVGLKTEGVVPAADFRRPDGSLGVEVGDLVTVTITGRRDDGYYTLSKLKVEKPKDWAGLQAAFEKGLVIGGVVTGQVKGGFTVDIGVRAFLPASRSGVREAEEMAALVGQEILCKIIKLDVSEEDVVVDRRAVLEEEERLARERAFLELQEGSVVEGVVRTLTDYGAFVDLGCVDALLHVSDMSWGRVGKPSEVVKQGDRIQVKILKIDRDNRKVSVGLKQLTPDPWSLAGEKYRLGEKVRGRVVRLAEFGAFVELEPGVEGLIRTVDMSWSRKVRKPSDVVKEGDWVEAVVTAINPEERRMSLSLKQALGDPWEEFTGRHTVGSVVEGTVTSLAEFGAFIEVAPSVEGMVHISDITRQKRLKHPKEMLSVGQKVKVQVLEIDREKRRLRLGMKQLEPTSLDEYLAEHKVGDKVSGRVVEVTGTQARVELGDGVFALCHTGSKKEQSAAQVDAGGEPDLATLTAMLAAKWKGSGPARSFGAGQPVREGQIRTFRITGLDAARKHIEVELAD